jgi:RHS repeat-associated protein
LLAARSLPSPRRCYRKRLRLRRTASGRSLAYNLRFPGQYYQAETGLNQNVNRDYDPLGGGRYLESDALGLRAGINTYGYASDNPVSNTDAFGLCDGQWVKFGDIVPTLPLPNWQVIPSWTCKCFWMCMPCRGAVLWDGNIYRLPSTWGVTVVNYSGSNPGNGGIRPTPRGPSGNPSNTMGGAYACACQPPDKETGCTACYRDSSPLLH